MLDMILPNGESKSCMPRDVYLPKLKYNLLSLAKASQKGKIVKFTRSACYILSKEHKVVAKASKMGSLYTSLTTNELALLTNQTQRRIFGTHALGI